MRCWRGEKEECEIYRSSPCFFATAREKTLLDVERES